MRMPVCACVFVLSACTSSKPFMPKSDYPPDPWVKGYAHPDDCLGGEKLAARRFALPDYSRKAYRKGRQGWVILRLDVNAAGETENVAIERSVPSQFGKTARRAAENWLFEPPRDGPLGNCRVLIRFRLGQVTLGS